MYGRNDGGFNRPRRNSFAPVKEGDEFDTVVEAVGEKGDGVCKKDGFVIFVPGVKQGDHVRVRITKVLTKVGFGEVVGEVSASTQQKESTDNDNVDDVNLEQPESEPEESHEDSEDFGEEPAEDSEEEPSEEPTDEPEEPKEDPSAPSEEESEESSEEPTDEPKEKSEEPKEDSEEEPEKKEE